MVHMLIVLSTALSAHVNTITGETKQNKNTDHGESKVWSS